GSQGSARLAPDRPSVPVVGGVSTRLREGIPPAAVPRSLRRRPTSGLGSAHHAPAWPAGRGGTRRRRWVVTDGDRRAAGGAGRTGPGHGQRAGGRRRTGLPPV